MAPSINVYYSREDERVTPNQFLVFRRRIRIHRAAISIRQIGVGAN